MRSILRHQPAERRRRHGWPRQARSPTNQSAAPTGIAPTTSQPEALSGQIASPMEPPAPLRDQTPTPIGEISPDMDFAAQRVRAAGGPTDRASYTCACGYLFQAPVTATVRCPHCDAEQAW